MHPGTLSPASAACNGAIDQKHNNGPEDGEQPGPQIEEIGEASAENQRTYPASEDGAYDAENECDHPAASLPAGKERLGDSSCDKAENEECKNSHYCTSLRLSGRSMRP